MPTYPPDSIVHRLVEHTCSHPGCTNSKLQGAAMRLCAQCKTLYYCTHAELLKRQAETTSGGLGEDFSAWRVAVGPIVFTWICVQGLAVFNNPDNIRTKFVVLSVRKRIESASTPRKMYEYVRIDTFDLSALQLALGEDAAATQEVVNRFREDDDLQKSRGKAGVALLIVNVLSPGDEHIILLRAQMPVILRMDELSQNEMPSWKDAIKDIINQGTSIKQRVARKEKAGEIILAHV
ncbi:hypothetical protein B0H13DRAFT_2016327 [Mycena leptocephala]|nr:hypothetical protein B0H13DRAFT_2016327 [Mycena leptocephala]